MAFMYRLNTEVTEVRSEGKMEVRSTVLVIPGLVLCTMFVLNPGLFGHDLNLQYEKLERRNWNHYHIVDDFFKICTLYYKSSFVRLSRAYLKTKAGFHPARTPKTKWSKRGCLSLVIPGHDLLLDITIFLGVAKNPGPSLPPLYNIHIQESFNYAKVYNLHNSLRPQPQQQQPWLSVYQSICLGWATTQSWTPSYYNITHRNNNINNTQPVIRTRNPDNCIKINICSSRQNYNKTQPLVYGGQRKRISIAHLNAESLKSRARFIEVKEMALKESFDILSISETWFSTSITNARVHLEGYNIYRLDRLRTKGGGVCV